MSHDGPNQSIENDGWRLEPFLHVDRGRVYNPLTDRELKTGEAGDGELRRLLRGASPEGLSGETRRRLAADGWLIPAHGPDPAARFRLKYVSLEAHTVCNQACYFCPVSSRPRPAYFMPTELYDDIVGQLAAHRETIEAVFLIRYNEPTVDKRFVSQVRTLLDHGLPPAANTNATGLGRPTVDALLEAGGLSYLSVNLSTVDGERYAEERRSRQLDRVLKNLDYAKNLPLAEQMDLAVLGVGDRRHRRDFEEISRRFSGSRFDVKSFRIEDRAGHLEVGLHARRPRAALAGCDNLGSRPLQHLHITPQGRCVLCCEDYDENNVVGDLNRQTVAEVLASPELAALRRRIYGLEEAPEDFICRRCIFARRRRPLDRLRAWVNTRR